jgi:hypothetical protein
MRAESERFERSSDHAQKIALVVDKENILRHNVDRVHSLIFANAVCARQGKQVTYCRKNAARQPRSESVRRGMQRLFRRARRIAMRRLLKALCAALGLTLCMFVGDSRVVSGDTASQERPPGEIDPFKPYALGPHTISYDRMSPSEQSDVDTLQENLDAAQSAASVDAFRRAATETAGTAELEVESRFIGLDGTEQDGVTP